MRTFLELLLLIFLHATVAREYVSSDYLSMLKETGQDEEFARLLGISDVNLVRSGERMEDPMFTTVSHLGDILLPPEEEEELRQGIKFSIYPGSKWRNNEICYNIEKNDFDSWQISRIESALRTLNASVSSVNIRRCTSSDKDFVYIFGGNGCYSMLGRRGGQQPLSLNPNGCLRDGTIQHECLHALGMMHEQTRPDRDKYVKVLFENIKQEWQSQYEKTSYEYFVVIDNYDYYSVMHYPMNAPGSNLPAFEILASGINTRLIGQRRGPTETDVRKVNKLYGN